VAFVVLTGCVGALAGVVFVQRGQRQSLDEARDEARTAAESASRTSAESRAAMQRVEVLERSVEDLAALAASLGRGVEAARQETRRLAEILETLPPPGSETGNGDFEKPVDEPLTAEEEKALAARFDDLNPGVRLSVLVGLRRGGGDEAREVARRALTDARPEVRREGASLCARFGDEDAVPFLVEALADGSALVREAAVDALRTLEGTDLGFDPVATDDERASSLERWRMHVRDR
jgi:hypothetical protein